MRTIAILALMFLPICTSGCSIVDKFAPRQEGLNRQSEEALNQETLLNIVRASQHMPLMFMAVSQLTGSQMEALNIGIATITFGPDKSAAAREFAFGPNVLQNSVTGGFTMNPLVSTDFQSGMLAPIPIRVIAWLLGNTPREPIFYATLDSIEVSLSRGKNVTPDYINLFVNDPSDDRNFGSSTCAEIFAKDSTIMSNIEPTEKLQYLGSELYSNENSNVCRFSKFTRILRYALEWGFTADLQQTTAKGASASEDGPTGAAIEGSFTFEGTVKGSGGSNPPQPRKTSAKAAGNNAQGNSQSGVAPAAKFCFDAGLANPEHHEVVRTMDNWCGNPNPPAKITNFEFTFGKTPIYATFDIKLRSPAGVFGFLGKLLRGQNGNRYQFTTIEADSLRDKPFLNIVKLTNPSSAQENCRVRADYLIYNYCVPMERSETTGILFQILQELRNLAITPADLNAPFSVRVVQ